MARKTAKDYRKELDKVSKEKEALEARIISRARELCRQHPDIIIATNVRDETDNLTTKSFIQMENLHIITALALIEGIEKELADRHPHKQTTINYTPEDPICNCDGRDMPVYKEDGKNWCPQCGYEVK